MRELEDWENVERGIAYIPKWVPLVSLNLDAVIR